MAIASEAPICVFCLRVSQGDYIGTRVTSVVRFEPLSPVAPGHMLFIPKVHVPDAGRRPTVTSRVMLAAAHYAGEQRGQAYNLITSSGRDATQSIFHLHIHYVPRWNGDRLPLPWTGQVKH